MDHQAKYKPQAESAFFADGRDERVIRFCFAKNEATLATACERLREV